MISPEQIIYLIGGTLTGGTMVAYITGLFKLKEKRMDMSAREREEIREDLKNLKDNFEARNKDYFNLQQLYSELQAKSLFQEQEIKRLNNRIRELGEYKSQAKLIYKLRKALDEYYKDRNKEQLIETFEVELLK